MEECERPVRQYEAENLGHNQSSNTGTQPQDSEWCRCVRLSATRLQECDALRSMWKGKGKRKGKENSKRKEKGKSKDKSKEGTSDTSNTEFSFCKGNDWTRVAMSTSRRTDVGLPKTTGENLM